MEKRFIPSLTLIGSLKPASVVVKHLKWKRILVATIVCYFSSELDICVAPDQTERGLGRAHEAVQFVAEAFNIVHWVDDDDTVRVDESLDIRLKRGSHNLFLLRINEVLCFGKAQEFFVDDLDLLLMSLLKVLLEQVSACGLPGARDSHHYD